MIAPHLTIAALLILTAGTLVAQPYDLLLRGGYLIDPKNEIAGHRDIAVRDGRVAAVEYSIAAEKAAQVVDVSGLFVSPGIIDIHTHLFTTTNIPGAWAGELSVRPDSYSFRTGVTTMVDAGSSGWRNFEDFRHTVIDRAATRVFALINISGFGMITDITEQGDFNAAEVVRLAKKHGDVVVGVKSAHYRGPDWGSVDSAVDAGRDGGLPVMVDFGYFLPQRPFWELVGEHLRAGDMPTHCFRGPVPWVDAEGKLYDYLWQAKERGIKFDVGHGGGSFVFRNAAPAIAQGFFPDSISTDLHTGSMNNAMMDMPTLMSKFLALGMPLAKVIEASSWNPAQQIGHDELGHLSVGAIADVAVFRLDAGNFRFRDAQGGSVNASQRLSAELTLKDGAVVWDWNSRSGVDYESLGTRYGIRDVESLLTPP